MSEAIKPKCCVKVSPAGSWRSYPCGKNASMEHEGKHYCKTHHPPTVQAKRDASQAKWEAEWKAKCEREKANRDAAAEQKRRADCYEQLVERVKELEEDMRLIAGTDPIEAMLDPQRAIRVANAALSKALPNTVAEVK